MATKIDALDEPERLERLREETEKDGKPFVQISAVTNQGTKELVNFVVQKLDEMKREQAEIQISETDVV